MLDIDPLRIGPEDEVDAERSFKPLAYTAICWGLPESLIGKNFDVAGFGFGYENVPLGAVRIIGPSRSPAYCTTRSQPGLVATRLQDGPRPSAR